MHTSRFINNRIRLWKKIKASRTLEKEVRYTRRACMHSTYNIAMLNPSISSIASFVFDRSIL